MRLRLFTLAMVFLLITGAIMGQGFRGTIRGVVQDTTASVIPGATVILTDENTGLVRTQPSSEVGAFNFPNLSLSTYSIEVELPGFKKYVRAGIQVRANQVSEVKATLEIGEITDIITTYGGSELVQTEDTQLVGGTYGSRDITELPMADPSLSGGDPISLAIMAPGTTTQSGGVVGQGGSIGGNRPRQNNFVVDGVDNNDPSVTGRLAPVIQEAVQEFTLLTNQFSAEYGHSTAGQFITTTKSGTNELHGGGWWYSQNRHTNALDNLTRSTTNPGDPKPNYDWNRFGGQVGGPIMKDKFFFFGAYEYRNLTLAGTSPGQILVPTSAGLSTLQNLAADPASGVSQTNVGIIESYVPTAKTATSSTDVLNEGTGQHVPVELGPFSATTPQFDRTHLFMISSDYQTGSHSISARYHYSRERQIDAGELPVDVFNSNVFNDTQRATVSDVWAVTPLVVNEFRVGYNRLAQGFPVELPAAPGSTDIFGNYGIDDISLSIGPQSTYPQGGNDNVYQVAENITVNRGAHTFKMGVDIRDIISGSFFLPRARGDYIWANMDDFARDLFPSVVSIRGVGNGLFAQNRAAFFAYVQDTWQVTPRVTLDLGLRYEYTQVARDTELQDLNGLANVGSIREEVFTPQLLASLGVDEDSPLLGTKIFDALPKRHQDVLLSHVGEDLIFRKPNADRNNFAPRIGFAWDLFGNGKTSVRGGIGMGHDVLFGNLALLQLPPQIQAENRETNACSLIPSPQWCSLVGAGGDPLTADIRYSSLGFLAGGGLLTTLPTETLTDPMIARAATGSWVVDDKSPETYTWSVAVQQEMWDEYLIEARYVGTKAVYLPIQRWKSAGIPNPYRLPVFLSESEAVQQDFTGAPTLSDFTTGRLAVANDPDETVLGLGLALAPYGFGGVLTQFTPDGQSWYHGGSVAVQKRFSSGLSFNSNYTFSKTIDWIENDLFTSFMNPRRPFNQLNPGEGKGLSGLHHAHKFAVGWLWEAPRIESDSGFVNGVLNGWQVNGTYLAESGQPLTIISRRDLNGDFDTAGDTAFENPGGREGTGTDVNPVCWDGASASIGDGACSGDLSTVGYVPIDPSARYIRGGLGAQTNMGRGTFTAPGINVWNLSFFKNTDIREGMKLQFRVELWNAFNHPNFVIGNGDAGLADSTVNARGFPGYVTPGTDQFLDKTIFSGGLGSAPFQRIIQWGLRLTF